MFADGPAAFWELDEAAGTTASDSTGNGNGGTYAGTYTHAATVAPIGVDNAASFGVTAVASTAVSASTASSALNLTSGLFNTVELWMYWDGRRTGESVFAFTNATYALYLDGTSIGFTTNQGELYGTPVAALANGWHLVDAEFENGSENLAKLYLDGAPVSLSLNGGLNHSVSVTSAAGRVNMKVGAWGANTGSTFSGQLDEVSLFKGALTDSQIANHWAAVDGTPANNAPPTPGGDFADGRTATASHGAWTGSPTSYGYQWRRCDTTGSSCADISGATAVSYVPKDGDVGSTLRVVVSATNAAGTGSATSAQSVPVFPMSAPHALAMQSAVLSDSPWGFWPLNDSSGTSAADASGNSRPLTVATRARGGDPQWGRAGVASDATSLLFRGNPNGQTAGDRAFIGGSSSTASQFMDNITAEVWVKFGGTATIESIFGFGDPTRTVNGWELARDADGRLGLYLGGGIEPWRGPSVPLNKWTHVALTRAASGGAWIIYLNGLKVGQTSATTGTPTIFDFFFAADDSTGGGFNLVGNMVDGAFYRSVLSPARILAHARSLTAPTASLIQSNGHVGNGALAVNAGASQAEPVDTATGNFYTEITDLQLAGTGVPFSFVRTYNSTDTRVGRFGQGWSDNLDWAVGVQTDGGATVRAGSGQQLHFTKLSDGTFAADGGGRATFAAVTGGGFQLVTNDQINYLFDSTGRLTSETDRNGQGLALSYNANGLSSITDSVGRVGTVTVTSGRITRVALPNSAGTVNFAYTSGLLTGVTDVNGGVSHYTYDTGGRLTTETDQTNTTVLTNAYDATSGRITDQWDARSKHTTFAWDSATQIATITDPDGNSWKDVYGSNVLLKQIDGTGDATIYGRDANLGLTAVSSPSSDQTTMTYDANGNILTATAPASLGGAQKTFAYDTQNNVTSVTDARGNVTTNTYDTAGNLTVVKLNNVQTAAYTYDTSGHQLTATDGNGKTTTSTYDSNGNVSSIIDPLGNKTTYTYDAAGRVLTKVDPLGNVTGGTPSDYTTTYTYDAGGDQLTEADPLGHTTTNTYDAAGRLLTTTDPNSHTTTNSYDGDGRLLTVTGPDPDGTGPLAAPITTYTYDNAGNKLTKTDPNNHTTTYTYDGSNRLLSKTTAEGNETTYSYDANGNLGTTTDPRGNVTSANPADYTTTYTYDPAGRELTATDPLSHGTTTTYDAVGNRVSVTDADNHTTAYTYDAAGRVLTVTAPDGGVTTNTYDGNGNVLTRTDDNSHTTTSVYDDDGHLIQATGPDPDGAGPLSAPVTTYSYDANGNVTSTIDPNGNATVTVGDGTTTHTYDHANRLTGIAYSDSTPSVAYTYDAAGNRTEMTDGAGSVSYTLDNLNRLITTSRGGDTFAYSYDAVGNVTARTFPGSLTTSYTYNSDNKMTSAITSGAETSYTYDPSGSLAQTTLPSGNGYVESRAYDKADRLIDVKNAAGSTVLSEFTATLDAVGNPTEVDRSGATTSTTTYGYDVNNRLTSVCFQASCPNSSDPSISWTYDKVGNRLAETRPSGTSSYTYNGLDELMHAGASTYTYDANGNELTADGTAYTYDLANRMRSSSDGTTTTTYSYDGNGNRLQASAGAGASATTNYLWDTNSYGSSPDLAIERDGSGSSLRSYAYGINRISMTTGTTYYYHRDLFGSVANLTSATGTSEWTYAYDPFGEALATTQNDPSAPTNQMQFASAYNDPNALYHLGAREYSPAIGRFSRTDPVQSASEESQISPYEYVSDRPTVLRDPSGMTAQSINVGPSASLDATSPANLSPDGAPIYADSSGSRPCMSIPIDRPEATTITGFMTWCWASSRITYLNGHFKHGSLGFGYVFVFQTKQTKGGIGQSSWFISEIFAWYSVAQGLTGADDPYSKQWIRLTVRSGGTFSLSADSDIAMPKTR